MQALQKYIPDKQQEEFEGFSLELHFYERTWMVRVSNSLRGICPFLAMIALTFPASKGISLRSCSLSSSDKDMTNNLNDSHFKD
jgi:hypothetical protein